MLFHISVICLKKIIYVLISSITIFQQGMLVSIDTHPKGDIWREGFHHLGFRVYLSSFRDSIEHVLAHGGRGQNLSHWWLVIDRIRGRRSIVGSWSPRTTAHTSLDITQDLWRRSGRVAEVFHKDPRTLGSHNGELLLAMGEYGSLRQEPRLASFGWLGCQGGTNEG